MKKIIMLFLFATTVLLTSCNNSSPLVDKYEVIVNEYVDALKKAKGGDADAAKVAQDKALEMAKFAQDNQEEMMKLNESDAKKMQEMAKKVMDAVQE